MPVTAKLSQEFYETFGDDTVNELVRWFNELDSTYQTQLREQIESSHQRFRAELDAGLTRRGAELRVEIAALRGELRVEMANLRADLIKWMFIFWAGTTISLAGTMIALSDTFRR